jgi:hypothetical protein
MKCMDCPLKYCILDKQEEPSTQDIRNTHDIRSNNSNTGYSNRILDIGNTYGTVQDTMEIITLAKKGKYLNALERYHIYKVSRDNLSMNDSHIDTYNPIFETLYRIYIKQQNTLPPILPLPLINETRYKCRGEHTTHTQHPHAL